MSQFKLPFLVDQSNKNKSIVFLTTVCIAAYSIGMHLPLRPNTYLTFSIVDDFFPLIEGSIWIYCLYFPYLVVSYCTYKTKRALNLVFYAFTLIQIVAFFVFIFFPTIYPVGFFPLSIDNGITNKVFQLVRYIDKPLNCFPSLHCANSYIMALGFIFESRKLFFFAMTVANAIAISTMTTKQHYFADVWAGFFLALGSFLVVYYLLQKQKVFHE